MERILPERIDTEEALDEVLTRPSPELVQFIRTLKGPLLILGAGGKMGPSLAVLARRAAQQAGHLMEIVAVSRFSDQDVRKWLEANQVSTLSCDLMDRSELKRLPEAENVIYLVGLKFGTSQNPARTWAFNTLAPANVAERYPHSRIVALSSGNVYPLVPVGGPGAVETDPLLPKGEYANSCIARERIFEYFSQENGTPVILIRLNYALDLRYGVLYDIAFKVFHEQPVDVTMGYANCIWQGDANDGILRSLAFTSSPAHAMNLTGPEVFSVRKVAKQFGELMHKTVRIVGSEAPTALLSDPGRFCESLGVPPTTIDTIIRWTANWVMGGGRSLNKPTHFETRDGVF